MVVPEGPVLISVRKSFALAFLFFCANRLNAHDSSATPRSVIENPRRAAVRERNDGA
jgi:hypothetical protein